jgi:ThiF family/Prokaryotic homologs of the JAB domain
VRYTLTFLESAYEQLTRHLFPFERECAAYLLCGISRAAEEYRLLVREVIPVAAEEIDHSSPAHMQIRQESYLRVIRLAADRKLSFVFVHSHPADVPAHSPQDDVTEAPLFRTAYARIHSEAAVHASIVLSTPERPIGRVWLEDGSTAPVECIRVIGNRFRFVTETAAVPLRLNYFSRQVLAFGEALQKLLQQLTVGIVGVGGTGSAVAEQLIRLGVGRIIAADGELLEESNVTRVYGSRVSDAGTSKVEILQRLADEIGLGTVIEPLMGKIMRQSVIERFRSCDVIFGCTDREAGRSILNSFALYYLIPVFDLGVKIESDDGEVKAVEARITTLLPGAACLFCRGRISGDVIAAEILLENDPEEYKRLRAQGYVPELEGQAPAVIPFTSAVASFALNELFHRLSGHMGADRVSTEVFLLFDDSRISRNSTPPAEDCMCNDRSKWGRGDADPFLGLAWGGEA